MEIIKINAQDFGIEPQKEDELIGNLKQIQYERNVLENQYNEVIKMNIEDLKTSKIAKELRLKIRDNRTKGIETWHKTTKNFFLKGSQFVDAVKNKEIAINERMESNLEQIEKYFENLEKQKIEKLQQERIELITPFIENTSNLNLGNMEQDVFEAYLTAKKNAYNDRIEAKRIEELERIEKQKAEAEAIEKQRLENEKLKAEAELREKEIKAERKKQADILAKERAEAEAKLKAEIEAKEKIEAELKAKKDAEIKAENEKLESEKLLKKEAEKLAKAPARERLHVWVDSFEIPDSPLIEANPRVTIIMRKFREFQFWAKKEIENM